MQIKAGHGPANADPGDHPLRAVTVDYGLGERTALADRPVVRFFVIACATLVVANGVGVLAILVGLGDWVVVTLAGVVVFVGIAIYQSKPRDGDGDLITLNAKRRRGRVARARNHVVAQLRPDERVVAAAFGWQDRHGAAPRRGKFIVATDQRVLVVGDTRDASEPLLDCAYDAVVESRLDTKKVLGTRDLVIRYEALDGSGRASSTVANILERNGADVHRAIQERLTPAD